MDTNDNTNVIANPIGNLGAVPGFDKLDQLKTSLPAEAVSPSSDAVPADTSSPDTNVGIAKSSDHPVTIDDMFRICKDIVNKGRLNANRCMVADVLSVNKAHVDKKHAERVIESLVQQGILRDDRLHSTDIDAARRFLEGHANIMPEPVPELKLEPEKPRTRFAVHPGIGGKHVDAVQTHKRQMSSKERINSVFERIRKLPKKPILQGDARDEAYELAFQAMQDLIDKMNEGVDEISASEISIQFVPAKAKLVKIPPNKNGLGGVKRVYRGKETILYWKENPTQDWIDSTVERLGQWVADKLNTLYTIATGASEQ